MTLVAYWSMKEVVAQFPLEFASYAAFIFEFASSIMQLFYGILDKDIVNGFSSFYFLEYLYPFVSIYEAMPKKLDFYFILLEKSI